MEFDYHDHPLRDTSSHGDSVDSNSNSDANTLHTNSHTNTVWHTYSHANAVWHTYSYTNIDTIDSNPNAHAFADPSSRR